MRPLQLIQEMAMALGTFPVLQIELRLLVWTSSTGWAEASQKWAETPFSQLDMPVLEDSIAAFSKKLLRLEQGLPSNQVRKPQGCIAPFYESCSMMAGPSSGAIPQDAPQTRYQQVCCIRHECYSSTQLPT